MRSSRFHLDREREGEREGEQVLTRKTNFVYHSFISTNSSYRRKRGTDFYFRFSGMQYLKFFDVIVYQFFSPLLSLFLSALGVVLVGFFASYSIHQKKGDFELKNTLKKEIRDC